MKKIIWFVIWSAVLGFISNIVIAHFAQGKMVIGSDCSLTAQTTCPTVMFFTTTVGFPFRFFWSNHYVFYFGRGTYMQYPTSGFYFDWIFWSVSWYAILFLFSYLKKKKAVNGQQTI